MTHPSLSDCEYGTVLFLGNSGTGKTFGLKQVLAKLQEKSPVPPLYTINVRDDEYTKDLKKHKSINFSQLSKIPENSVVIIEDIINLTTKEEIIFRQLLNQDAHHRKLKVFCVSHNIFKTNIYNTVTFFKFIVFTSSLGNLFVINKVFAYLAVRPEISTNWQEKIRSFHGKQGIYFYFDNNQRKLFATNNLSNSESTREIGSADYNTTVEQTLKKQREILQQRFQLFFKGRKNSSQAFAVFSIINECLDPNHINSIDLSLQFRSREGKLKSVSLTDYFDCMLEKNPNNVPHKDFVVVHNYVTKHCNVPAIFLLNKHFV